MSGHGHVTPNLDGRVARCGGPLLCGKCFAELKVKLGKELIAKINEAATVTEPKPDQLIDVLNLRIGDTVIYNSYGTPNGEYKPEPRAAIVTCLYPDGAELADPEQFHVGLCVLSPTGMFFNQLVPFHPTPKPGHWMLREGDTK